MNLCSEPKNKIRIETVFDACKYRGCKNRRQTKGGIHLFRFPSRVDARLLTWIKHTGNKLILNWSLSTLRKAGICGDHFSDDSFRNSKRKRLKLNAVPQPYKEPRPVKTRRKIWDHTYSKKLTNQERDADNAVDPLDLSSEPRQHKDLDGVDNESGNGNLPWRTNFTFVETYSRKLSFKDPDDSIELMAIEPGCPDDNKGELRAIEAVNQSVSAVETTPTVKLEQVEEDENREIKELREMNTELKRQNKMLRIENSKLQLKLAATTQCKLER